VTGTPARNIVGSVLVLVTLAACGASEPPGPGDATAGGAGGAAVSGVSGSAGSLPAGAPHGGGSSAGASAAGAGGSSPLAGAGGAGGGGGGMSTAGGGGSGGGSSREVKPSAGCARQSTDVSIPNSLIAVPPGYDGKIPVPAVMAFHAAGNDNTQMERTFEDSDLAKKYFMVYPNASGNGWNMQADKSRYLDAYDALLSQACVDENRIYATGHSSGAQMIVQLLCSGEAAFDAVAPVASSVYCQKWKNGAVPALIIHGVQDSERQAYGLNDGNGEKDLQPYLASNGCQMTSMPFDPDVSKCGGISKGIDDQPFSDGCVAFDGCTAKTRWCNHNDPSYGTSNHGIPCFGVRAMYDFFESL
jgi:hypothetical protein